MHRQQTDDDHKAYYRNESGIDWGNWESDKENDDMRAKFVFVSELRNSNVKMAGRKGGWWGMIMTV